MPNQPTANKPITLDQVLSILPAAKAGKYLCPACDQWHLTVKQDGGKVLVHCFTPECEKDAAWKRIKEKLGKAKPPKPYERPTGAGLTVEKYAQAKALPSGWLRSIFCLRDSKYQGVAAVEFPYLADLLRSIYLPTDDKYQPSSVKWRWGMGGRDRRWQKGSKASLYGELQLKLFWSMEYEEGDWCFVVEGESDTQTLLYNGFPVLGVSGAEAWRAEYANNPLLKDKTILVVQEPEAAGEKLVQKIANSFPAGRVRAVKLPDKDSSALWLRVMQDNGGFEALAVEKFAEELNKAVSESAVVLPMDSNQLEGQWNIETFSADEVKPKIIRWLWEDRIPLAKFTLFYGLPGQGKSTVTRDLIARVTRGDDFPDRKNTHAAADVLMMVAEDDIADTVVPGLMAARADLKRVKFTKLTKFVGKVAQKDRKVALDKDLAAVERLLVQNPSIRLLVIDPISSYLGDLNRNKDGDVRPLLDELKEIAARTGVTVVAITHFNKNSEQASIHRISGAGAWGEAPRALWAFVPAPVEEGQPENDDHLMLNGKLNITSKAKSAGLKYQFADAQIPIDDETATVPKIVWGDACTTNLDDVLQDEKKRPGPEATKTKAAVAWLRKYLVEAKPSADVFSDGEKAGHSKATLFKAKEDLGIKPYHPSGKGPWWWPALSSELEDSGNWDN